MDLVDAQQARRVLPTVSWDILSHHALEKVKVFQQDVFNPLH